MFIKDNSREQILEAARGIGAIIAAGVELPDMAKMASVFCNPDTGDGKTLAPEQHVMALSEVFITTLILLAERIASERSAV